MPVMNGLKALRKIRSLRGKAGCLSILAMMCGSDRMAILYLL